MFASACKLCNLGANSLNISITKIQIRFFRDLNGFEFEVQDKNNIEGKSSTKRKEDDNTFSQESSNISSVEVFPEHKRQKIADSEHI